MLRVARALPTAMRPHGRTLGDARERPSVTAALGSLGDGTAVRFHLRAESGFCVTAKDCCSGRRSRPKAANTEFMLLTRIGARFRVPRWVWEGFPNYVVTEAVVRGVAGRAW